MVAWTHKDTTDRLSAALCEDSPIDLAEQLALVQRMVLRERRAPAPTADVAAAALPEPLCDKCLHELDPDGYCDMCGRLTHAIARSADAETRGR